MNETVSFMKGIALSTAEACDVESSGEDCPASRGEARVHAILEAALELVSEVGYDRMTMDAIAQRAKASKATMYRHWPGKPELVRDALCHCSWLPGADPLDSGSLRGDLLAVVHEMTAGLTATNGLLGGLMTALHRDTHLAALVRDQIDDAGQKVADVLVARARGRGEAIAPLDAVLVLELAPGQILLRTLVLGKPTGAAFQEYLVDEVLLPLLTRDHASVPQP
jgi:AcrR family transcriptional regulator